MNRRNFLTMAGAAGLAGGLAACGTTDSTSAKTSTGPLPTGKQPNVLQVSAPRMAPAAAGPAGAALMKFGCELYLDTADVSATGNASISPYSVYVALAMTAAGARGTSAAQFDKLLGGNQHAVAGNVTAIDKAVQAAVKASGDGKDAIIVEPANSVWTDPRLAVRPDFLKALAAGYSAGAHQIDFGNPDAATTQINGWVSERTHTLIPKLLDRSMVSPATRLVLVNALYLKATWAKEFDKPSGSESFTTAAGATVKTPMMRATVRTATASGDGWTAVRLPYRGGQLAMTIVLPDKGKFADIRQSLASVLTAAARASSSRQVEVQMPPFTMNTRASMKQALAELGLVAPFSAAAADLSGIAGAPGDLSISFVQHQSVVKVNEHGTEAAAATAAGVEAAGAGRPDLPFVVDRAFFFVIHDTTTGAPLFLGQVSNPTT